MELLTGDRQLPQTGDFPQHIDPFTDTNACNLVYDQQQTTAVIHPLEEYPAMIIATNPAPPRKLRPIRSCARSPAEDHSQHPPLSDLAGGLAGSLDRLPELGFLEGKVCAMTRENDGECFEDPARATDVADNGGGTHGLTGEDSHRFGLDTGEEIRAPSSNVGVVWGDMSVSSSSESEYDSSADVKEPANGTRKRKTRNQVEFFLEHLVTKVMEKQEQMHKQLIEMIERRERERMVREEAWKRQEIERMKRDEEVRTQEMSRSLALISIIENMLGHEIEIPQPSTISTMEDNGGENGGEFHIQKEIKCDPKNRRWPEAEVQALIMLRSALDQKFHVMGSKGSIWDEISVGMCDMGYNRTAKKCKEKWENINKYFRKSIDSGKKHPENSKSCPYFQELDVLYKNGLVNPGTPSIYSNQEAKMERE